MYFRERHKYGLSIKEPRGRCGEMERGILSVSPDPIPATHEFRCFEEQGKRWSRQGSIMTPEKSHDGMAGRGIVVASTICDWFETGCGNVNYSCVSHLRPTRESFLC